MRVIQTGPSNSDKTEFGPVDNPYEPNEQLLEMIGTALSLNEENRLIGLFVASR